jgi:glycosyl transferase, family 25
LATLPPLFVISLAGAARRARMEEQLARWNGQWCFFDAINGEALTEKDLADLYDENKTIRNTGRPLSSGEIACALSHASVYRRMIADGIDRALILEDDVVLHDRFFEFPYDNISWDFDVISFFTGNAILHRRQEFRVAGVGFRRAAWEVRAAAIYLVSLSGARKLEQATKPLASVADWPLPPMHMKFFLSSPFFADHPPGNSILGPSRMLLEKCWSSRGRLPRFAHETLDLLVSALFIRYLVNRDRYTGVNGYIYREIMPYIMRKLPFLYFCVKKR